MNDRFKFRVWNIKHGLYCDQMTEMVINSDGVCYDNGVSADYFKYNGFIIEQCTGFSDKNGNLIYEGDVVWDGDYTWQIKWNKAFARWVLYSPLGSNEDGEEELTDIDAECLKIIGNIHEQAEQKDVK